MRVCVKYFLGLKFLGENLKQNVCSYLLQEPTQTCQFYDYKIILMILLIIIMKQYFTKKKYIVTMQWNKRK